MQDAVDALVLKLAARLEASDATAARQVLAADASSRQMEWDLNNGRFNTQACFKRPTMEWAVKQPAASNLGDHVWSDVVHATDPSL